MPRPDHTATPEGLSGHKIRTKVPTFSRRGVLLTNLSQWKKQGPFNRAEAEKLVRQVEEMAKRRYVCDYEIAQVYTVLGEKEHAFRGLNLGKKQQCDCLVWLQSEPWMDPLRIDPRYSELVKRVFDRAPATIVH
jgi:hypothetical protein